MVRENILRVVDVLGPHRCSIDLWQCIFRGPKQFLKGWGANLEKDKRSVREDLLKQVANMNGIADSAGLDKEGWTLRYHLDNHPP
jgi:hypothetical protein